MRYRKATRRFALLAMLAGCSSGIFGERPKVSALSASDGQDFILVTMTVADEDLTACDVAIEYLPQGDTVWLPAAIASASSGSVVGNSITDLHPGDGGAIYTFEWDSWADNVARGGAPVNIQLRATPSDRDGTGEAFESALINVDNNIAVLEILEPTVDFAYDWGSGANPADQNPITLENTGSVTMNWSTSVNYTQGAPGWLTVPASGTTAVLGGTSNVNFSADPVGQTLVPGTYIAVVTVDDPVARDAPQDITVTLTISPPMMNVTPPTIDFAAGILGAVPTDQTFQVANTAAGTSMNWAVDTADVAWPAWLSVNGPSTGSTAGGGSDTVTLSVNHAGLAAGAHVYTVTVLDSEDPDVATITNDAVAITLTVSPPVMDVTSATLDFVGVIGFAAPANQTFDVANTAAGTGLNWEIDLADMALNAPWLAVVGASTGSIAGVGSDTVTLSIDHSNPDVLTAGVYTYTLTVLDSEDPDVATITNDVVTITLTVRNPQPDIELNGGEPPAALNVSCVEGQPVVGPVTFDVKNVGDVGSDLTWTIDNISAAWLGCAPMTNSPGALGKDAWETVTATINTAGLIANPGPTDDYTATITISGVGAGAEPTLTGDKTLTVNVDVLVPPQTDLDDATPSFTDGIANVSYPIDEEVSIVLTNSGEVDLVWTAAWNVKPAWLEAVAFAPSGTVLAAGAGSETFTLKVDTDANGLTAGTHTGSIDITDQYSNITTVTFTLVVKNQAALATSPASFTVEGPEGGAYPVRTLSISNSDADDSPFNWTIDTTGKPTWLLLSSTGDSCSSETDTVDLTFDTSGLLEGYTDSWTLTVNSADATSAPDFILVTLNVTNPYIWVDGTSGTPAGPGTEAAPYQTIGQAMAVVVSGNTVKVKPGTYVEEVNMPYTPIQLISQYGAAITTIQAPIANSGNGIDTTDYYGYGNLSSVEGFTIRSFYSGIDAWTGINVRDCIVEDNYYYGIRINYAYGCRIERNTVRGTQYAGSSWAGVRIGGASTVYVLDNLIVGNAGTGLHVWTGWSEPSYIINNTLADNGAYGLNVTGNDEDLTTVMNNICVFNATTGIYAPGGVDSPTLGNNNVYGNGINYAGGVAADASDISQPPGFVGTGAYPYDLGAGTSCVDGGDNAAPELPATDILGEARIYGSFVDIGCYEWTPSGGPTVDYFDFSTIPSPQAEDVSFAVTITAKTAGAATATDFDGAALLSAFGPAGAGQKTIGTGTLSWYYPLYTYYHDARTQVIYLASEMAGPMTISSLALNVSVVPAQIMNNWTIRLKHTSLDSYPVSQTWETSGWTVGHQSNANIASTGWATFTFTTPFVYNGIDNLMIDFSFDNASYTSYGEARRTNTGQYRALFGSSDSWEGDPLLWSGSSPMALRSFNIPNIRLGGTMAQMFATNPNAVGPFVGGVWTGDVAVLGNGAGVYLTANDGNGHTGQSNSFDVDPPPTAFPDQSYLKASNTEASDNFGDAISIDGDTIVVGAFAEDSNATGVNGNQADNSVGTSGAAYVFTRTLGVWSQQAYLKASNPGSVDSFGCSVAVDGDTIVVGAKGEDSSGAAYVFTRTAGVWSQQAYLKASNTDASDRFGQSVAISGDTIAIGAYGEDSSASGVNGDETDNSAASSGAVYVFTRTAGVWSQQAYIKAHNPDPADFFGLTLALDGDTIVVGTYQEDSNATGVNGDGTDNSSARAGAAYVFTRTAGVWSQQAYLKASNTGTGDSFGRSVAISGDTIIAGANMESSNATGVNGSQLNDSATNSGAAYVFTRTAGVWSQQAYLKASNTEYLDYFGYVVTIDGDMIVVGAHQEDSNATGVNSNQADNSSLSSGAAYVFTRTGSIWSQHAYLKASNTDASDAFGDAVAVSSDTVIAGARAEASNATGVNGNQADNSAAVAGAVYVFK